jgi:hypothetical protein
VVQAFVVLLALYSDHIHEPIFFVDPAGVTC